MFALNIRKNLYELCDSGDILPYAKIGISTNFSFGNFQVNNYILSYVPYKCVEICNGVIGIVKC